MYVCMYNLYYAPVWTIFKKSIQVHTTVMGGAVGAGAASRCGSTNIMRLQLRNTLL
jgi:hypothetical protein